MTDPDATIRNRYLAITATRLAGSAGALLGLVLIARADAAKVPVPRLRISYTQLKVYEAQRGQ
ncbi:hypothetical protein [Pseudomonas sp. EL_65y_Pfl1_R83]|uniref:hypothetical protein n=1 Tax=Pseudomonas sp. EL_65y_Pfl1_R83 TaxID=3088697 RepID=UPI0030DD0EEF